MSTPSTITNDWTTAQPPTSWYDFKDPNLDAKSQESWVAPVRQRESSYTWCLKRKSEILALQSSKYPTKVFAVRCDYCSLFFKHCMFSKAERKSDNKACRWCQADNDEEYFDTNQWAVHWHIHCNKPGAKICEPRCNLDPPVVQTRIMKIG